MKFKNYHFGVFILRIALGIVFLAHGADKLVHLKSTVAFFASVGLPPTIAFGVGSIELIAGLFLILGIFTSVAGIGIMITMIGAIIFTKMGKSFLGGYEYECTLLLLGLAAALLPAGKISAESFFDRAKIDHTTTNDQ